MPWLQERWKLNNLIDIESLQGMPIYAVLQEYCRVNSTNVQDIDALDNYCAVIERLRQCLDGLDFRFAGTLTLLGWILLRIQSEKLLLKNMSEEEAAVFISKRSSLYRVTVDMAVRDAISGLIGRHKKDKIVIDRGEDEGAHPDMKMDDMSRRRETSIEDVQRILYDDEQHGKSLMDAMDIQQQQHSSVERSVVGDFDMGGIMSQLKAHLPSDQEVRIDEIDMDDMDAFVAALHLSHAGAVEIRQESFYEPIFLRNKF